MIERDLIAQKIKEHEIQEFIEDSLDKVGHSHTQLKKTPLGEKIIITASRPGLVVGRKGANIRDLTKQLKNNFDLENPQIEINEVQNIFLDPKVVAEKITSSLERYGTSRFKGVGHKMLSNIMDAGALGVEILISGKIPGSRARSWRFYQGYLKKSGEVAVEGVKTATETAELKSGSVGVKVKIMPPDIQLPDKIEISQEVLTEEGEVKEESKKETEKKTKKEKKKKTKKEKPKGKGKSEEKKKPKEDNQKK